MKKHVAAVAALAIPILLAGCGGASGQGGGGTDQVIKVGSLHPLTGASAADGQQMDNGAKLAADDINAAGGIKALGGAKIQIDSADTQGKPETGQSEAQRLIQSGAVGLVGTYQSAVSANVATVAERNRVPFVIDISTADSILKQGYKYTFRVQPSATVLGTKGGEYISAVTQQGGKPAKKVAMLHEQGPFGTGVRDALIAEGKQRGFEVSPTISYDAASVSDLTTQMTEVKASGADILVVTGYYRDGVLAAKAVQTVKPSVNAVFGVANGAFDLPSFPGDAAGAGEGFFDANYHYDVTNPDTQKVVEAFKSKYGSEPRTGAVLAYDAVRVIADSMERSKSKEPQKVRDAIAQVDLKPRVAQNGNIKFDAAGENVNGTPILMQVQNSKIMQVFPDDKAEAKPKFPVGVR